jgi:hypothetical protein
MANLTFKTPLEAEEYLEKEYANKLVKITYYTQFETKTYVGKVDRLAIDYMTRNPAVVLIFLNDGKRFEVDKDDFFELVTKLN